MVSSLFLSGDVATPLAALMVTKLILTALCVSFGLVGGLFAPSLLLGATAGATVHTCARLSIACLARWAGRGALAGAALPLMVSRLAARKIRTGGSPHTSLLQSSGELSVCGAAAMLAAMFKAPLTGTLIVFEMSQSYHLVLPAMLACGVAAWL